MNVALAYVLVHLSTILTNFIVARLSIPLAAASLHPSPSGIASLPKSPNSWACATGVRQPSWPAAGENCWKPGFPFWPSWSVYDSRLPAAMQRFSHYCQVRYSFRCRSGLRMLADHGVPAKPEGPLATPLPRRPSATRVRWLFRAVDVTLRAQAAPRSVAACRRTAAGSDTPRPAAASNTARA